MATSRPDRCGSAGWDRPQSRRLLVRFLVRAHAWVGGFSNLSGCVQEATGGCFSPSRSPSLPLSLEITKYFVKNLKILTSMKAGPLSNLAQICVVFTECPGGVTGPNLRTHSSDQLSPLLPTPVHAPHLPPGSRGSPHGQGLPRPPVSPSHCPAVFRLPPNNQLKGSLPPGEGEAVLIHHLQGLQKGLAIGGAGGIPTE